MILTERMDILNGVAQRLLEKEKIEGPEFEELYVNNGQLPASSASAATSDSSSESAGKSASESTDAASTSVESTDSAEKDSTSDVNSVSTEGVPTEVKDEAEADGEDKE